MTISYSKYSFRCLVMLNYSYPIPYTHLLLSYAIHSNYTSTPALDPTPLTHITHSFTYSHPRPPTHLPRPLWWRIRVGYTLWNRKTKFKQSRTGCPKKHGISVTNSISSLLWISIVIPNFKSHRLCLLEFNSWKR